ncbi:MAG TPA: LysM peptidoglycan-binding domain-containing protein [Candidatus Acidoferrales bacterium]|nr:LysM peptidoglycan-binding domain-containing protein [Candidatus Acidoferrales bacterium]
MAVSRYLTHAVVISIAVGLSGFATIDRHLPAYLGFRLGAVSAEGAVMGEGGSVGDVSLGRLSTIIKPLAIPTSAPVTHSPSLYTVVDGEDLAGIAARFGVTVEQIRWSNIGLKTTDRIKLGDKLNVPPVQGVVVTTQSGDTVESLAAAYRVDPNVIADFNRLRDWDLPAGLQIVVPGGKGPELTIVLPDPPSLAIRYSGTAWHSIVGSYGPGPFNATRFPWGYCTWYAATKRNVTWGGDAWYWWDNARAAGYPEGQTAKAGAIMVTGESWLGHVAYVEQTYPDGSWLVSEMNFVGYGIVSSRTIRPGQLSTLRGFIYG